MLQVVWGSGSCALNSGVHCPIQILYSFCRLTILGTVVAFFFQGPRSSSMGILVSNGQNPGLEHTVKDVGFGRMLWLWTQNWDPQSIPLGLTV